MTNDLLKVLRGQRVDGRTVDEVMALAADEIVQLRGKLNAVSAAYKAADAEQYQEEKWEALPNLVKLIEAEAGASGEPNRGNQDAGDPLAAAQAEIAQLRGNLSLAEEGLASATQEVEQLKVERDFARRELDRACQETREALSREVTAARHSSEPNEQLVTTDYGPALLAICKWSGCTSTIAEGDPYFCPTHRQLARRNAEESSEQLTTSREDGYAIQRAQLKSSDVEVLRGQESAINDLLAGTKHTK